MSVSNYIGYIKKILGSSASSSGEPLLPYPTFQADMDDDSSKEAEFEEEAAIPKNKRGRKFKRRNLAKPIRVDAPKKTQRKQRRSKKKSS